MSACSSSMAAATAMELCHTKALELLRGKTSQNERGGGGGGENGFPALDRRLPSRIRTSNDFSCLSDTVFDALAFLDQVYDLLLADGGSGELVQQLRHDQSVTLALQSIAQIYEELWITKNDEIVGAEKRLCAESSSLGERPDARRVTTLVIFLARLTLYALSPDDKQKRMMGLCANSFPGVRQSWIAQSAKPVMTYTATELVAALDALAFAWNDLVHSPDIDDYVFLLSLRYGLFLRCAYPAADYGTDKTLIKKAATNADLCVPSTTFVGIASSRFETFMRCSWQIHQYNRCNTREDMWAIVTAQDPLDIEAAVDRPLPFPSSSPRAAELEVIKLLARYSKEGANSMGIREDYSRMLTELSLWPGDRGVFDVRERFKIHTAANVLKMLHGKRVRREVYRRANVAGPQAALTGTLEHEVQRGMVTAAAAAARTNTLPVRSTVPFEAEIAGLCTLDALFRGKYGVSWSSVFLITCYNHSMMLEEKQMSEFPRIALLWNTFDVIYQCQILRTQSFFESVAWWLAIVAKKFTSRIPLDVVGQESEASKRARAAENDRSFVARKKYCSAASTKDNSGRRMANAVGHQTAEGTNSTNYVDISELCRVVEECDETKFAVRTLWTDSAVLVNEVLAPGGSQRLMVVE